MHEWVVEQTKVMVNLRRAFKLNTLSLVCHTLSLFCEHTSKTYKIFQNRSYTNELFSRQEIWAITSRGINIGTLSIVHEKTSPPWRYVPTYFKILSMLVSVLIWHTLSLVCDTSCPPSDHSHSHYSIKWRLIIPNKVYSRTIFLKMFHFDYPIFKLLNFQ